MKNVAVVAWREVVEHRVFFAAAVAASSISLVAPFVPGIFGWAPGEVRGVLSAVMTIGFTTLSALTLGAATISGTVVQGRFGFFMARPLSGAVIWFGKIFGALIVVVACELIVVLPAVLSADGPAFLVHLIRHPWLWSGVLVGAPLVLILVAHATSTMWRARTAWLALDGASLIGVVFAGWLVVQPLLAARAEVSVFEIVLALVVSTAVAVLAAGVVQVVRGGVDLRRHHRALSTALWVVMLPLASTIVGYGHWLATPTFGDVLWVDGLFSPDPRGRWVGVSGLTSGRRDIFADFACNPESGESLLIGIGPRWRGGGLALSRDGAHAVWTESDQDGWWLHHGKVGESRLIAGGSPVFVEREPQFALSERGDRVATIEGALLVVTAMPSGDLVFSTRLPEGAVILGPDFASDDRLRFVAVHYDSWTGGGGRSALVEYDIGSGEQRAVRELEGNWAVTSVEVDDERDRLLFTAYLDHQGRSFYLDGTTFEEVPWSRNVDLGANVSLMADGRLARVTGEEGARRFEVLNPDGFVEGGIDLPSDYDRLTIGSQPSPDTITMAARNKGEYRSRLPGWEAKILDLESWKIREIARGYTPMEPGRYPRTFSRPYPIGSPATKVFLGVGSSLNRWDPATSQLEELVPGYER
jgi:hypothetical protein